MDFSEISRSARQRLKLSPHDLWAKALVEMHGELIRLRQGESDELKKVKAQMRSFRGRSKLSALIGHEGKPRTRQALRMRMADVMVAGMTQDDTIRDILTPAYRRGDDITVTLSRVDLIRMAWYLQRFFRNIDIDLDEACTGGPEDDLSP